MILTNAGKQNFGIPRKWRRPGQAGRMYINYRECTQVTRRAKILPDVFNRDHSCSFKNSLIFCALNQFLYNSILQKKIKLAVNFWKPLEIAFSKIRF